MKAKALEQIANALLSIRMLDCSLEYFKTMIALGQAPGVVGIKDGTKLTATVLGQTALALDTLRKMEQPEDAEAPTTDKSTLN